jgi:hypothetical protein
MRSLLLALFLFVGINLHAQQIVHFSFGKADLKKSEKEKLESFLSEYKPADSMTIYIGGHTDSVGSFEYNKELSERRVAAVKTFMLQKGYDPARMITSSFGKTRPFTSNQTDKGRALNRRVEVMMKKVLRTQNSDTTWKTVAQTEKDTLIQCENGTQLVIKSGAFGTDKIREMDYEVKEVLNAGTMILNDMIPQDIYGNCLISGGMVQISASKNGRQVQPVKDSMVLIRIPVDKPDTSMRIYTASNTAKSVQWTATAQKPKLVNQNGRLFYEAVVNEFQGYNCDHVPTNPVQAAAAITMGIRNILKEKSLVVKSSKLPYRKAYMLSPAPASMVKGFVYHRKRKSYFNCENCLGNDTMFLATFFKNGQLYIVNKSLKQLKYRRFFNRYIIRKQDYEAVTPEEFKARLAKL